MDGSVQDCSIFIALALENAIAFCLAIRMILVNIAPEIKQWYSKSEALIIRNFSNAIFH